MSPLCVVLLSGELPPDATGKAKTALENRGFEVFAERPLTGVPEAPAGADFQPGGRALLAFNALMKPQASRGDRPFADFEVEKAAHLLANTLDGARDHLRVSADAAQAERLVDALLSPRERQALDVAVEDRRAEMHTDLPVLADLSRFKYRAKVELVSWNGRKAVKKTFRRTALDAMVRELAFFDDIAPHSPVPPRVLARSGNAIIFEHIENALRVRRLLGFRLPIPLRLRHVRELADFVHLVVGRGWDPIDLTPRDNILVDAETGRLRAIDFEFAHRRQMPVRAQESYFMAGVPPGAEVARPLNQPMQEDPYPGKWRMFTGMGKRRFLQGPAWAQQVERVLLHPIWLAGRVAGALFRRRQHAAARDALLAELVLQEH